MYDKLTCRFLTITDKCNVHKLIPVGIGDTVGVAVVVIDTVVDIVVAVVVVALAVQVVVLADQNVYDGVQELKIV